MASTTVNSPTLGFYEYPISSLPMTRKLTTDQAEEINSLAQPIIGDNAEFIKIAHEFNEKPYEGDIWDHINFKIWPFVALKLHRLGTLTAFQVATTIFQSLALSQFVHEIQLPMRNITDMQARYTLTTPSFSRGDEMNPERIYLNDKRFDEILTELIEVGKGKGFLKTDDDVKAAVAYIKNSLANAPFSEQCLFMMKGNVSNYPELLVIYSKIYKIPLFGLCQEESKLVFPSFSIMQAFINFSNPTSPVVLDPVIGHIENSDISQARRKNQALVKLPLRDVFALDDSYNDVDGIFAGRAVIVAHQVSQALKNSSLSLDEKKAVNYILDQLLTPYIQENKESFSKSLNAFFNDFRITDLSSKKYIKDKLAFTKVEIDLRVLNENLQLNPQIKALLTKSINEGLLESFTRPELSISRIALREVSNEQMPAAIERLATLKQCQFKICIAELFHELLDEGKFYKSDKKHMLTELFEHPSFKALSTLNPEIRDLIESDLNKNPQLWEKEFGVNAHFEASEDNRDSDNLEQLEGPSK